MASKYEELEELADLKDKGIITEDDFNRKKKELLSREEDEDFLTGVNGFLKRVFSREGMSEEIQTNKNVEKESGSFGIVGFILAILSIFTPEVSLLRIVLVFTALIMSSIGSQKNKSARGLAIAGVIISISSIIFAIGAFATFYG